MSYSLVYYCIVSYSVVCTIYNMSGRVVSDIQTRAEGESLYIRYNTAAHVVNSTLKTLSKPKKNKRCLSRENQS